MSNRKKYDPDKWEPLPSETKEKDVPKPKSKFQKRFENRTTLITKTGSIPNEYVPPSIEPSTVQQGMGEGGEQNHSPVKTKPKQVPVVPPAVAGGRDNRVPTSPAETAEVVQVEEVTPVRKEAGPSAESRKNHRVEDEGPKTSAVTKGKVPLAKEENGPGRKGRDRPKKEVNPPKPTEIEAPKKKKSPKPKPKPTSAPVARVADKSPDEDGDGGTTTGYVPYTLQDYQSLKEKVSNEKLGGLGPADTDEQRIARERKKRQQEYGAKASKIAREKIAQEAQQRTSVVSDRGSVVTLGESVSDEPDVVSPVARAHTPQSRKSVQPVRQPPTKKHLAAVERRDRALAYARNLPPVPTQAKKERPSVVDVNIGDDDTASSHSSFEENQKMLDLEAKHRQNMATVEAIRRQLRA